MEVEPMSITTFAALLSYVIAAGGLATTAVLTIKGAEMSPLLVGKFIRLVTRRNV